MANRNGYMTLHARYKGPRTAYLDERIPMSSGLLQRNRVQRNGRRTVHSTDLVIMANSCLRPFQKQAYPNTTKQRNSSNIALAACP